MLSPWVLSMTCSHKWWKTCEIYLFSLGIIFICFIWMVTKGPSSSPRLVQIFDSFLNITFIQLSTLQYFSLACFNVIFSRLWVSAKFYLTFININSISYNGFLTFLLQFWLIFLYIFCCFGFSVPTLVFRGVPVYFQFFHPHHFIYICTNI